MSMIFRLRALSDENDAFLRVYDIPYDSTLLDFHRFICADLGFDSSEMASFFTSGELWERLREYTLAEMGDGRDDEPETMGAVCLGQIMHNNRDRLIHTFDILGDRSLYMELSGCYTAEPGRNYPAIHESAGDAPGQFEAGSLTAGVSIFDEAMDEFGDFGGDETYDDEF